MGDIKTIQQLAELGVIFLMFGVGLHFSFQDLWRVRDIAIPGSLAQTAISTDSIEITWLQLDENSPLSGQTLAGANIRSRSGASVVAMIRNNRLVANPKSSTTFAARDRIGIIGENNQIELAMRLLEDEGKRL